MPVLQLLERTGKWLSSSLNNSNIRGVMNVVETIREKVFHLPLKAQEEVLEIVEQFEERYQISDGPAIPNGRGGIQEIFGWWAGREITKEEYLKLDHNERIDFDLAKEYCNNHEDEY